MQSTRLFEILYILLNKEHVRAKDLAERFEVSSRTIYRDIDALSMAGVPVYTKKGKGGGIHIIPGFVMDKSMFDEHEQQEILASLQGLAKLNANHSDTIIKKLAAIFDQKVTNWLEVDFSEWGYDNTQLFTDLKTAIIRRQLIEFDYLTPDGKITHRQVEPMTLWFKSTSWYLKAFCLLRQSSRIFKLTRIRNLTLNEYHFAERELLLEDEWDETEKSMPIINFKLKIAPAAAYRIFDDFRSGDLQADGSYLVNVSCCECDWIYNIILSYGEQIEIIEPTCARETLLKKVRNINRKYL